MAELLAGEGSFDRVMHRDLSSSLDVIPAGGGEISSDGLAEVIEALAASYDFVVAHASDWRSDVALAAMDCMHKAVIVAPAFRLRGAVDHAQQAMGGASDDVLGFLVVDDRARVERAA